MPSFQSRAATAILSALGVRKRLQLLADARGTSDFDGRVTKIRRQDKRQPPFRLRRLGEHTVVDIDDCELHRFVGGDDDARPVVLYLHGGGYMFGPFGPEWKLAEGIASATDSDLGVLLYPRAPESTAATAISATTQAITFLGSLYPTKGVTLIGTSAGGGLAVAAVNEAASTGVVLNTLVLISPAVDMDLTASTTALEERDVLLSADFVRMAGELYAGDLGIKHPWVSPINGDLSGLPPTRIYGGGCEILLPSIRDFADRAAQAGSKIDLVVGESEQHTYPTAPTPEGKAARSSIAAFIRSSKR